MRAQHPRPRFCTRQIDALAACDVCTLRPWAGDRCAGQLARSATAQVHFRCSLRCAPSGNVLFLAVPPRVRNACSYSRVLSFWLGCAQEHFSYGCLSRRTRTRTSKPRARRVELPKPKPKVRSVPRRAHRHRSERHGLARLRMHPSRPSPTPQPPPIPPLRRRAPPQLKCLASSQWYRGASGAANGVPRRRAAGVW